VILNNQIKVSVVIPTYNRAELVSRAVMSILSQSIGGVEIVVVNDGSTDNTMERMARLVSQNNNLVIYNSEKNRGVNWARNYGVNIARGKYILFLDSDEYIIDKGLNKVQSFLEASEKWGHLWFVRLEEESMKPWNFVLPKDNEVITFHDQIKNKYPGDYVHVLRKDYLIEFPFYEEFMATERITWLQISKKYGPEKFIDIPIVISRRYTSNSLTKNLYVFSEKRLIDKTLVGLKEIEIFKDYYCENDKSNYKKLLIKTIIIGMAASQELAVRNMLMLLNPVSKVSYFVLSFLYKAKCNYIIFTLLKLKSNLDKIVKAKHILHRKK
jgi:glycosyltransferase involved in cell wall biosynthesis